MQTKSAATVVVHCGDLDGGRLERRLRELITTLPDHVRVIATALGGRRLSQRTAGRVKLVVVRDGGAALLEAEVALSRHVLVVPLSARTGAGWFEDVLQRLEAQPEQVGVLALGTEHFFAYPTGVTELSAGRVAWHPVTGLSARRPASSARNRPSLGAVLIVKDEEARLPECLDALTGVVDEVVVYDTGSTDSTADIARRYGAVVVEGHWDADFSAARNRALQHATTEWVLSVDADEVLEADHAALDRWLTDARGDAALVVVVSPSVAGATSGDEIRAVRLFRRAGATWVGALHEQVVPAGGAAPWTPCATLPPVRLLHSGYVLGHEKALEKAQRNLSIAEAAHQTLPRETPEWAEATVAYARALGQAERADECIEVLRLVRDREVTAGNVVQAARGVIPLLMDRGLLEEAGHWTERAAAAGESCGLTELRRALLAFGRGDRSTAVAALEQLVAGGAAAGGRDVWSRPFDMTAAVVALADLQVLVGRSREAATTVVQLMLSHPHAVPLGTLLRAVIAAGGRLDELATHAPAALVERSLREAPATVPDLALAWVTALADADPGDVRRLVAGSVLAARTSVEVALEWSVRVREAGLPDLCPLRAIGTDTALHPRSRMLALGLLHHGLADVSLDEELDQLTASAGTPDRDEVLDQLRRYVPEADRLVGSPA